MSHGRRQDFCLSAQDRAETDEFAVNKAGTTCRLQVDRAIRPATYTLAGVPTASSEGAGAVIYVSNGAAESPIIAYSDGITWLRSDTGRTFITSPESPG